MLRVVFFNANHSEGPIDQYYVPKLYEKCKWPLSVAFINKYLVPIVTYHSNRSHCMLEEWGACSSKCQSAGVSYQGE